jgi:hypothetical protein
MFSNFKNDQYDMFETLPNWYVENYDTFRGRLREVNLNATTAFFLSNARNKMYMMWWWSPTTDDPIKVTFEINIPDGDALNLQKATLKKWLSENGYKKVHDDGKIQKNAIFVDTIDDLVILFKEFMS